MARIHQPTAARKQKACRISPRARRGAESPRPLGGEPGCPGHYRDLLALAARCSHGGAFDPRPGSPRARREEPQGLPPVHASPPSNPD